MNAASRRRPPDGATAHLTLLAFTIMLLAACGRPTTTVDGCIGASAPSGSDPSIVDAVVMVVPASEQFDKEWQRLVQSFANDYRTARANYDAALKSYRGAQSAERSARAADREIMKSAPSDRLTVRRDRESGARVWSNQAPPGESYGAAQARAAASRSVADAERQMGGVISAHTNLAVDLIKKHQTTAVRSDYKGCYSVKNAPTGKVYVFANRGERYWLREATFGSVPGRADFSATELAWPFR